MGDSSAARAALEGVRLALEDATGKPIQAAGAAREAVLAMTGEPGSAEAVHTLVHLARRAQQAEHQPTARELMRMVRALAVGDAHAWLQDRSAPFQPDPAREEALRAVATHGAELVEVGGPEARLLLAASSGEPDASWVRGRALLWSNDACAAEAIARDTSEAPLVRAAAILRVARDAVARGESPPVAILALLREVVAERHDSWGTQWAPIGLFAELDEPEQVALLSPAARVDFDGEVAIHLTQALVAALDVIPDQGSQRAALAGNLITFALGARVRARSASAGDVLTPLPDELSSLEREVVQAVARKVSPLEWNFDVHHSLFHAGLPGNCTRLRRWLGLDPAGLMERPVSVEVDGARQRIPLDLAAQRMRVGRVEQADLARAMATAFGPADLVALTCEDPNELNALCEAALGAVPSAALVPVLLARLDSVLSMSPWNVPREAQAALLLALARGLEPGEPIPERFDPLLLQLPYEVGAATVREVLARVGPERCERILRRATERVRVGRASEDYDDLLSEEGRREIARIRARPMTKFDGMWEELFTAVDSLRSV
ncbi:MAG: hypothetical protein HOO96_21620 [Polyangiaceae bacterium]|nr:hypothetical protein [Polyangiaceae bacterium]